MKTNNVITGKSLIRAYSIPAKRAYFSRHSRIYEVPAVFPAAFCDLHGYIVLPNIGKVKQTKAIKMSSKITIFNGLKCLEGYQQFSKPIQVNESPLNRSRR